MDHRKSEMTLLGESQCEEETVRLGSEFAADLRGPMVISLEGPLGAGKTRFVRGLAEGLGIDTQFVASPTFPLVHEYDGGRLPLFHFDFYRLNDAAEALDLGFMEYAAEGVCAVEWGDRFPSILPLNAVRLRFSIDAEVRRIERISA